MNSKKNKHKKPNKSNQNLPKKEETDATVPESATVTESAVDLACVVPKPITEVAPVPLETEAPKDLEAESPKKPKRNKGKKKKVNEADGTEEDKSVESIETKIELQVTEKEEKIAAEEQSLPVEPAARKNKNKKKNHEQVAETAPPPILPPVIEVEEQNVEIHTEVPEESKTAKKNNKKKKPNDSDKSDRNTEEVSTTSAFEALLKEDDKIEEKQKETETTNVSEVIAVAAAIVEVTTQEQSEISTQADGKNKKKGKKDKKKQADKTEDVAETKPVSIEEKVTEFTKVPEPSTVLNPFKVCESIEELITPESSKQEIESKDESTVKAKIAKPVEKKRKGKHDTEIKTSEDVISEPVKSDAILSPIPEGTSTIPIKTIEQSVPLIEKTAPQKEDTSLSTAETADLKLQEEVTRSFEAEKVSDSKENVNQAKNKKKKKQMKVPENSPVGQIQEQPINKEEVITMETSQGQDFTATGKSVPIKIKDEILFESLVSSDPAPIVDENLNKIIESISQSDDTTKDNVETIEPFQDVSSRKKKKGRKSPKPPLERTDDLIKETATSEATATEMKKEPEQIQKEVSLTPGDKEAKPTKSEGSSCDIAPEIQYPRSTSQQLDRNNNMMIRELLQEVPSNIPTLTPTNIEGSGETPIGTPQMISSDIKITEIEPPIKTEEKTDLKSKMMEVNQDMEELRLSIERSLAEFTSMEKTEKAVEKQFEDEKQIIPPVIESPTDHIPTLVNLEEPIIEKSEKTQASSDVTDKEKTILPETKEEKKPKDDSKIEIKAETCSDSTPPVCPARKDNKGKGKNKKGKQDAAATVSQTQSTSATTTTTEKKDNKTQQKDSKTQQKDEKTQQKSDTKGKQKAELPQQDESNQLEQDSLTESFEPIEDFEDALTSIDDVDVNKSFEMILKEVTEENQKELKDNKPEIKITGPDDTKKTQNVPQPKNLLGRPSIPVSSNRKDYKKEKNKPPNSKQARVKIKDCVDVETGKINKENKADLSKLNESFSQVNQNEDFVYKYSFRKVFLQSSCVVCKKELLESRVPCKWCNLVFYCSADHCNNDWRQHKEFCDAVKMALKLKDLQHIYSDAQGVTGHEFRLLRMEMILACERELKRRLVPWEQEVLLYPRMCADVWCRSADQGNLKDCEGCGQISYCTGSDHLPKAHQRWCKSYALYQKLVTYQQTKGRLLLKMPTRVMSGQYQVPQNMNEVLASMYEEKIDMTDIQYAALTQIATAPLTTLYSYQLVRNAKNNTNGLSKNTTFTIHVVGAELQFEADMLNKWEVFFLHLKPDVRQVRVALVGSELNPGNLPLELLGKTRMCEDCRKNKRKLILSFHDKTTYHNYMNSDDFVLPDIVCAFNPAINRSTIYNGNDPWPSTLKAITRLKVPLLVTAHTITELQRDLLRVKECCEVQTVGDLKNNPFASVRPDRNFITDDETPLLFKNYCFMILTAF